ncbi:MAG TPA: acyltransferase [Thermoanaerobaculia bacterium]
MTTLPNSFPEVTYRDAVPLDDGHSAAVSVSSQSAAVARNIPIGYLRAFVTLMVVAHHAVLAYLQYAPHQARSLDRSFFWAAFPVVDSHRWPGVDLFVGYNDTFFMSLMFLLSGVFVWSSLLRKGAAVFARDRILRLGLPFVVSAGLLAPLAYYPAWLLGVRSSSFWKQWLALEAWPAGPAWFLWVLLAFGLVAAAMFAISRQWGEVLGRILGRLAVRPIVFVAAMIGVSALAYMPMAAVFTPEKWLSFGPFFAQTSRLVLYAVYFFAGIGLGAYGVERGLLAPRGKLAARWYLWALGSVATFLISIITLLVILGTLAKGGPGRGLSTFGNFTFVLTCTAASIAFVAVFVRFARTTNRVFENLSANAYGIYIFHYFCVSWLQLSLVHANLPGAAKGTIVFAGALALSWSLTAALRQVRAIRRVI